MRRSGRSVKIASTPSAVNSRSAAGSFTVTASRSGTTIYTETVDGTGEDTADGVFVGLEFAYSIDQVEIDGMRGEGGGQMLRSALTLSILTGRAVRFENLRGKRADEAIDALDGYLDSAYLAGLPFVRIIHGKGTGKLRLAVREALNTHPHVKSFNAGEANEGGDGVTVAKLKTS